MKKLVLILTAVLGISSFASAEGLEGFFIGGNLTTSTNNQKSKGYNSLTKSYEEEITVSDNSYFNFTPTIGYTFNDDWEMALEFGIDINKNKIDNEYTYPNKRKDFGVALTGRRYFELSDRFNWHVDASLYFEKTTNEHFNKSFGQKTGYSDNNKYFGVYIVPGIDFEISDHWTLDMNFDFIGLTYGINKFDSEDADGNPYGSKGTSKYFDFYGTTAPGTIHDLTESISLGLYYTF